MKQTAPVSTAIVFLLALNLRPAVTSLGAALEDVSLAPGMTASVGAILVALPLWASGIGGWITPWLKARIGIHRAVTWALIILAISLVVRVQSGAELLIAGTALACLAIAIVGTVLPVLVQPAASRTKASFTLALGAGSTIGALVTPTLVTMFSWQFALAAWAALALVTVQAWQRAPRSSMVFMARALNPRQLFHSGVAWHLTIYFGLVSTLTFLIMGWLPAILRDAGVSASYAGFCLALSMAMGLPMMWLVPFGVNRMRRPGILVVVLAVLNGVGVAGLLVMPAVMPWLWSGGLGLGMGGLAMALTLISVRAAGNPDITTALSGMVQGLGYFIAGIGALACGLIHSATGSWELPLIVALVVLCGQVWSGVRATRPIVVAPRPIAELGSAKPKPDLTRRVNGVRAAGKAGPRNGARVVPEPWNGVQVTGPPQWDLEPDVTQPVKGVWITAVSELGSARLPNGTRVTAQSDLAQSANGASAEPDPANGVQVAVPGPESETNGVRVTAVGESDVADRSEGVRVTAEAVEPERLADGVRVTAGGQESHVPNGAGQVDRLPQLVNGVWVAGPARSEQLTNGVPVARVEPESDSAELPEGVRVTAGPADVPQPVNGVRAAGPDMAGPSDDVRVAAVSESDVADQSEGVRVTAAGGPESEVPEGVRVTAAAESIADLPESVDGVVSAVSVGAGPDLAESLNGMRVAAVSESELAHAANGVRVTAVGEPESDVADRSEGVRVTAEAVSAVDGPQPVNGVRAEVRPEQIANGVRAGVPASGSGLSHFTNGAGVPVRWRPVNGGPVEVQAEQQVGNGVPATAAGAAEPNGVRVKVQPNGERVRPEQLANGVRVTASVQPEHLASGVRVTSVGGRGSGAVPFTNGAGVAVPRQPKPVEEVRVPAQAQPGLSQLVDGVPESERLAHSVMVTALIEAAIPLPRQPIGPMVGPPIGPPVAPPVVQTGQPEAATQDG